MNERQYNKLVRDNIPDIIKNNGDTPITRILEHNEYIACLYKKLQEEVNEYIKDDNIEELCDVLEVLEAIISAKSFSKDEIKRTKHKKAEKNGAFKDKIFLEKVIINH